MKKLVALLLAAVMIVGLCACDAGKADGKYTIGICQWVQHPALDAATEGFIAAVEKGLGKENITWEIKNASNDPATCTSIVTGFVSSKVDMIMANATPALTAAYNATEVIPILGTSVTEYGVALGLKNFSGTVGGNVSGTSDLADLNKQAQMIIDWCPDAKNVGLLYCSTEANSGYQIKKVREYLEGKGLTCKDFPFSSTTDLNAVTEAAAAWSDAIYVPTDNTVATYATAISGICVPAGVPIIAGEAGICSGCGIATMSIDYYDLGVATGEMAVKILKGEAKISEMPIAYTPEEKIKKYYNKAICDEMGIDPLEGYEPLPQ